MRLPTRKSEVLRNALRQDDSYFTQAAIDRMRRDLERLEKTERPLAAEEVHRTKQMGDLSENAAYQEAKVHLRRINDRITTLGERLKHAVVIDQLENESGKIRIGSVVKLSFDGKEITYEILGSHESNPREGRISHISPLGKLLLGHVRGDNVVLATQNKEHVYHVLSVE